MEQRERETERERATQRHSSEDLWRNPRLLVGALI